MMILLVLFCCLPEVKGHRYFSYQLILGNNERRYNLKVAINEKLKVTEILKPR